MFICAICGLKQTGLREEKALAGFDTIGHSGSYQHGCKLSGRPAKLTRRPAENRQATACDALPRQLAPSPSTPLQHSDESFSHKR